MQSSEVVVRPEHTLEDLKRKVRIATILGTLQSTSTDFRYLSKEWKKNAEVERLLGVSLTGIMDHPHLSGNVPVVDNMKLADTLQALREVAVETITEWASKPWGRGFPSAVEFRGRVISCPRPV